MNPQFKNIVANFAKYCQKELNIERLPKIQLIGDKNWVATYRSFGEYNPAADNVKVFYKGRNTADVLRSLAHELVHHRQEELGMIEAASGDTGSEIENEANALAGVLLRDYGKEHIEIYDLSSQLNEVGEVQNPYPWKYNFTDDDGNIFYSFETPQNKYSVGVTDNGDNSYEMLFNTEGEMGYDTGEGVALKVLSTVFDIANDFVKEYQPDDFIIRPTEEKRARIYKAYAQKNLPIGYKLVSMGDTHHWIKPKK